MAKAAELTDELLLRRVKGLAGGEREATVELIVHLAELDARRLHRAEGFGSLFSYCTGALHLSEQAAYKRIVAARISRRFPLILGQLVSGALNLSGIAVLAPHLTAENCSALLEEAAGLSRRGLEDLVARRYPRPDVPTSVRTLPLKSDVGPAGPASQPMESPSAPAVSGPRAPQATVGSIDVEPARTATAPSSDTKPAPARVASQPSVIAPLSPERYRLQFTIGQGAHEKLRQLQELLFGDIPDGDPAVIFDRALTALLAEVLRKKAAITEDPHRGRTSNRHSRHIPAAVKRTVWLRDGGRCAFVARSGRRCAERKLLEFHHLDAYALGGDARTENVALRCREHNAYEAELIFGKFPTIVRESRAAYYG